LKRKCSYKSVTEERNYTSVSQIVLILEVI
jgi:hypothetical protein